MFQPIKICLIKKIHEGQSKTIRLKYINYWLGAGNPPGAHISRKLPP